MYASYLLSIQISSIILQLNQSNDRAASIIGALLIAGIFLVFRLLFGSSKEEKDVSEISPHIENEVVEEPFSTHIYSLSEIKSQIKTIENSGVLRKIEIYEVEFEDGLKGQILHDISGVSYYFKGNSNYNYVLAFHYNDYLNCAKALHYYLSENEILKVDFLGSYKL